MKNLLLLCALAVVSGCVAEFPGDHSHGEGDRSYNRYNDHRDNDRNTRDNRRDNDRRDRNDNDRRDHDDR